MELKQLKYLIALAETSSFTKAAQRCAIAQSALSHQIAQLEDELGVLLFERTTRSVRITEAGYVLLDRARQILDEVALARAELDTLAGLQRGRLRVGMTQTASQVLDPIRYLSQFHDSYPRVQVFSRSGPGRELIDGVADGHLDVGLAAQNLDPCPPRVIFRPLAPPHPLVAVTAPNHRLGGRERVSLGELARAGRFIEMRVGTELRRRVDEAFQAEEVTRTISAELGQIHDMIRFVAHGEGIAIVPAAFTQPTTNRPAPAVRAIRLTGCDLALTMGAYLPRGTPSAAATAFLHLVPPRNSNRRASAATGSGGGSAIRDFAHLADLRYPTSAD